jgi:hypothetical protein
MYVGMRSIIQPEREREEKRRRIIAKHNKPHEIRGNSFIRSWVEMERGSQGISFEKNIYSYTSPPPPFFFYFFFFFFLTR